MLRAHLCCALLLASCATQSPPAEKEPPQKGKPAGDPWSESKSADDRDKDKNDKKDSDGAFDLKSAMGKIAESISKPGPYEAPEKSKDFDDAKPHWGVVKLDGSIVERQALSLIGGRGIELRTLIERLRELAGEDKLAGVLLRVESIELSLP